uniref:Uncharacterized protein n=1 Tax=Astyanax mexicanus TaxID=7994 RepID=A0A3B1J8I1_ASTMX
MTISSPSDIHLMKAIYLTKAEFQKLKARWIGQTYHSTYNSKKRGTSILFSKTTPYIHSNTTNDPKGRFIIINGSIHKNNITIASIYGPNSDSHFSTPFFMN